MGRLVVSCKPHPVQYQLNFPLTIRLLALRFNFIFYGSHPTCMPIENWPLQCNLMLTTKVTYLKPPLCLRFASFNPSYNSKQLLLLLFGPVPPPTLYTASSCCCCRCNGNLSFDQAPFAVINLKSLRATSQPEEEGSSPLTATPSRQAGAREGKRRRGEAHH